LNSQLQKMGMDIPHDRFYTASQAIAEFLIREQKHPWVNVFGSKSLHEEIKRKGARITTGRADFVVVTATKTFTQKEINQAIEMIQQGAKFITANDDKLALTETGAHAGNGSLISPIERATGCRPYVVGKPNHLMIRGAEEKFGIDPKRTWMIGDNLDTDINVGIQAQMKTVLVLSGVTGRVALSKSSYQPTYVRQSVAQLNLSKLP
jgi:NagD protein